MLDYSFSILNLRRRADRRERFINHHTNLGYDAKDIHFHYGRDGKNYTDINAMRDEMVALYPQLQNYQALGFGNIGCLWGACELFEAFINGTPDSEFIYYNQDDHFMCLRKKQFDRVLEDFIKFDPNLSCLKLYWHSMTEFPEKFQISGYDFTKAWWGFGDSGIFMDRKAAKTLLKWSLDQACFVDQIMTQHNSPRGFYSYCRQDMIKDIPFGNAFAKDSYDPKEDRVIENTRTKDKSGMGSWDYYQE